MYFLTKDYSFLKHLLNHRNCKDNIQPLQSQNMNIFEAMKITRFNSTETILINDYTPFKI